MKYLSLTLVLLLVACATGWTLHVQSIRQSEQHSLNMMAIDSLSHEIKHSLDKMPSEPGQVFVVVKWANSVSEDFSKNLRRIVSEENLDANFGLTKAIGRQRGPSTTFSFAILSCSQEDKDQVFRAARSSTNGITDRDAHVVLVNEA